MSDIDEFEHWVPQNGLRMRIKRIVQKVLKVIKTMYSCNILYYTFVGILFSAAFYGLCPSPQPFQYLLMSRTLCDKCQDIDANDGKYWVNKINAHKAITLILYIMYKLI